jgi:hypothetical protein
METIKTLVGAMSRIGHTGNNESLVYWHSIRKNDRFALVMLNNTKLRKGYLYIGEVLGDLVPEGAILSPYTFFTDEKRKEALWEAVRKDGYPGLPSRTNALFLFPDQKNLRRATNLWWSGEERLITKANVSGQSKIHKADSKLLDCTPEKWRENAHSYWQGSILMILSLRSLCKGPSISRIGTAFHRFSS